MKRFAIFLLALGTALAASPATAAERNFSMYGFEDIRINGAIDVVITTGKGVSARAEAANRRVLDRIDLRHSGDTLLVTLRPKTGNDTRRSFGQDEPVKLWLTAHAIKEIFHNGSGSVSLDKLSGSQPRVRLSGFGSLEIGDVDSNSINIRMNGGGELSVAGEAGNARIELLGSSTFNGDGLTVEKLDLFHRGPASSHLSVKREAHISNSGTGIIRIDGKPNCMVRSAGSAQIICNPKG